MVTDHQKLPKLLYLGDVPVEPTHAGSALIYRLLSDYRAEDLKIIEANLIPSGGGLRLPGVRYETMAFGWPRLQYTRFVGSYQAWMAWRSAQRSSAVERMLGDFAPQAVLSVTHGCSWLAAAAYARRRNIPLHLILHDEWHLLQHPRAFVRRWAQTQFRRIYRQAVSRLCVSPFMEELYQQRYGVPGTVLYPARARDATTFDQPPERLAGPRESLVCGYAGSINSPGYMRALRDMADALKSVNGTLLVFGPVTRESAAAQGLDQPNIRWEGMVSSNELIRRLRAEADFLFAPMSFDEGDRYNMEISFPSKLTDYTAMALPVLIYGPTYASAVRWAGENLGGAELVSRENVSELQTAVTRIAQNEVHRSQLANKALQLGKRFFSHESSTLIFNSALATRFATNHLLSYD